MHICFITSEFPKPGFPHGGVGTFVQTIAKVLVKTGVKVSVVGLNYTNNNESENINGIQVYRIKPSKVKGLAWFFNNKAISNRITQINAGTPIDIVETSELGLAFITKIKSIKYIIRLHGGHHFFAEAENREINWWKGFQEKRSFKNADAFIAVSEYVKKHTANYLSYNGKPIQVIFYPIDVNTFSPIEVVSNQSAIVYAGTICEKKGVRQLIQAFPLVKEKFPNAILNLYGRDWKFPNGSSYIKMLQEDELPKISPFDKDVVFHGSIDYDKIPETYAKAAVCVFPSHMETLGLVAPEAMAMQRPVVFTQLGPGPEVIKNGETGFLCNPHNPKDIADKILLVLKNPEKATEIGIKARQSVLQQFEINTIAKENINYYTAIINN
ncbi:glycosyltransferase family 4 protein [Flavobacterium sp.]|uniref:glycosyltransferase family 4 protein n=1 Tax=Flavobacterium sp. TaxID=239 RepID=UPI003D26D6D3